MSAYGVGSQVSGLRSQAKDLSNWLPKTLDRLT
jgi:hypothetical protein